MHNYLRISKLFGVLLMLFSISMIVPLIIALVNHQNFGAFVVGFFITVGAGFLLWFPLRRHPYHLKVRDGFLMIALVWFVLSLFGAVPIYISLYPHLSVTNAVFEAVSGLTTTGGTILQHIDRLEPAFLFYRQQLHLLGGMGIIVLMVAIMPMLGVGGMRLYRAESVGPLKTDKLEPRMAETAKLLWSIYLILIVACAIAYWWAGMTFFEAVGESFSTVATGGFSMHDKSFAYYHSDAINCIAMFFMLLGASNFALHYKCIRRRSLSPYLENYEWRSYLKVLFFSACLVMVVLGAHHYYRAHHHKLLIDSFFTVISLSTTTGFSVAEFSHWPSFLPYFLMLLAVLGGCIGSTSGGIKMMRYLLLQSQGMREFWRLVHPRAVFILKLGDSVVAPSMLESVWGFIFIFIVLYVFLILASIATGLDFKTAFAAVTACLSNAGASIGMVSSGYSHLPAITKWLLIFAMIAGRLEIFALLVIFMPRYWKE